MIALNERLGDIARAAELAEVSIGERTSEVRFASIADLVSSERACAWTLGGILDADQFARLSRAAEETLAPFRREDGEVRFAMPALILRSRAVQRAVRAGLASRHGSGPA